MLLNTPPPKRLCLRGTNCNAMPMPCSRRVLSHTSVAEMDARHRGFACLSSPWPILLEKTWPSRPERRTAVRRVAANAASVVRADRAGSQSKSNVRLRPLTLAGEGQRREAGDWFFNEKGQKDWVDAMELKNQGPELAAVLRDMGVNYNPRRLANALKGRELEVSARAVRVTYTLGRFIASLAKDSALGQLETNSPRRAVELQQILAQLGPSFVKIGQALSSRPDLLPQVYLEALSKLQDRLPSFPTDVALTVMEEELKRPVSEVYSELSPEPVAAASLGQVYKGRLRATGEQVAVKIQRPNMSENIAIDMLLLRRLMALVDKNLPSFTDYPLQPLVPLVDEFAGRLFAELDYVQEGHNAERFESLYGNLPHVRVPGIKWDCTARRVLTMEWIDGVKLTDKEAMARNNLNITDFVDIGIQCSLRQLLAEDGGLFHADPHPGNLLATTAGDLVYLDFGMMSEAPKYARLAIIAHVCHLINRDYPAMCQDYYRLQFMDPSIDTSPIAPALAEFFDDVLDQSISQLNFKSIVDGLGGVLFQYPFRVPAYYALILRSLTVLEGLALSADPNYKLLAKAYPYIARRLLTDTSPELRESFRELILTDRGRLRWTRLENLLQEGSKSQDFDPQQLWLLAEWVLGPQGSAVRGPLCNELVRLLDAVVAEEVRVRILRQTGNTSLAERLVPMQLGDATTAARARTLFGALFQRMNAGGAPIQLQGSGPFGLPQPGEVNQLLDQLQARLGVAWPQIQGLLNLPGAADAQRTLAGGLMQRATARAVKLILGPTPAKKPAGELSGARSPGGVGSLGGVGSGQVTSALAPAQNVQVEILPPVAQ